MNISSRLFKPTIVDLIFGPSWAASTMFIAAGAGFTALAAQFVVPLNPVPITAQTLAVMIVGLSLGATRGALAIALYALLGAVGLPVFSASAGGIDVLTGTSGGYIFGYILAAWIMGKLAERQWDRTFWKAAAAGAIGTVAIYAAGILGLILALPAMGLDYSPLYLLEIGVAPFLIGAAIKVCFAAALLSSSWKKALRYAPQATTLHHAGATEPHK
ncbi:biotin transporter BioY [Salinibacterium sp. NK8237]|uniref:biotin transporter BioY n=1 Tax=Salinibacterium sp. NK8237 TaxID=2792038 RepID=UPI0018CC948A|nr:biotin transporter BioY [Salinibacterium sp. NK8237]MBH0129008.1 biotin transporter BioY [Salinibacterium sp. NK8237]